MKLTRKAALISIGSKNNNARPNVVFHTSTIWAMHALKEIGKHNYSRLHNLSVHQLASYVIARRGLGFKEAIPAVCDWVLSHVGEFVEPRVKQSSPYRTWSMIHDLFKHSGITSFKTSEIMRKALLMRHVLNSVTSTPHDNLKAGLSISNGRIDDY